MDTEEQKRKRKNLYDDVGFAISLSRPTSSSYVKMVSALAGTVLSKLVGMPL